MVKKFNVGPCYLLNIKTVYCHLELHLSGRFPTILIHEVTVNVWRPLVNKLSVEEKIGLTSFLLNFISSTLESL